MRSRDREEEVSELFGVFYPRLAGWTARLVDVEVAHDIATEAFVRLYQHWAGVEQPQAWLYMTAANLTKDHWRSAERERRALVRLRPVDDAEPGPDQATRTTVRGVVESLPERLRTPVLLYYFADLPVAEVAAVMDRSQGTVKRALFDARALMATALAEETP